MCVGARDLCVWVHVCSVCVRSSDKCLDSLQGRRCNQSCPHYLSLVIYLRHQLTTLTHMRHAMILHGHANIQVQRPCMHAHARTSRQYSEYSSWVLGMRAPCVCMCVACGSVCVCVSCTSERELYAAIIPPGGVILVSDHYFILVSSLVRCMQGKRVCVCTA